MTLRPDFTKWPRLLVVGERVTPEQAEEIILRTTTHFMTNEREFEAEVVRVLGCSMTKYGSVVLTDFRKRMNALELSYLDNHRIASCWIGGAHGWCDWDGTIGCTTYNIGKWPSFEEVDEDWSTIAKAFPFLRLRSQLVRDEGEGDVVAEWIVAEGRAVAVDVGPRIAEPTEADWREGRSEIGITIDRLQAAYVRVLRKVINIGDNG